MFREQLSHAQLVDRVHDRPEKAHGDGFHALLSKGFDHVDGSCFVERPNDLTRGTDPLRYLKCQRARNIRFWVRPAQVEDVGAAGLSQNEDVGMAGGGQEGCLRGGSGENCVESASGAVDEVRTTGEELTR